MNSEGNKTEIVSCTKLREAVTDSRTRLRVMNETLGEAISQGERALDDWRGSTAEEFGQRMKKSSESLSEVMTELSDYMNKLEQIVDIYERPSRQSGQSGSSAPLDDEIY